MEPTKLTVGNKKIDVREGCIYLTMGKTTYYIDEIAPLFVRAWIKGEKGV
jgi:hypothetical protein